MALTGFFAYPSHVAMVVDVARAVARESKLRSLPINLISWEESDIAGQFIRNDILRNIKQSDYLVADISRLNFNVVYEIGYAIACGKRLLLVKNRAITPITPTLQEVGIFDTLGYHEYSTTDDLLQFLRNSHEVRPLLSPKQINEKAPIYWLQPKTKTDYDGFITSSLKKSYLYFRSFDPTESPRLSGPEAIESVSESIGVVLHLLPREHVDAEIHNVRSAFVAGLAEGMDKRTLFIQTGETPIPLDLRDFVKTCRFQSEFKDAIGRLAELVYEDRATLGGQKKKPRKSILAELDVGASAAENEIVSLGEYYLEIDAFRRARRKEVRLVTGRKGSGKTAIFFMLRDQVRANRLNVVLDLKPEGYQLLKFKDTVVSLLSVGTLEHTITAFWEYLLWLEICYKLIEKDQELHKRDHTLYEPYQRLKAKYLTNNYSQEGDFSERLKVLLRDIAQEIEQKLTGANNENLTTGQITELVYRHDFAELKQNIIHYLLNKNELWLLFDNIDKGWASQGVSVEDLVIIRALIQATRKIERELQKLRFEAHTIVFLRNDIFEHLVDSTADRGKETRANVDWDDTEMLLEMVRKRIVRNISPDIGSEFGEVWDAICTPIIGGENSAQYLIDRCLMRPRSLIDLIGHCRGYAMNLGHDRITSEDIQKGCNAFSNDLLAELDLEVRDVFPSNSHLLYAFIGAPQQFKRPSLISILNSHGVAEADIVAVINLLLWFGFLGFVWTDGSHRFIYSFNYNMKVLEGTHAVLLKQDVTYVVNHAFAPALGLQ